MRIKVTAMLKLYDVNAPKKATNVSVNSDLLSKAKGLEINLSATLEHALYELIKDTLKKQWLLENKEAIVSYNEFVEENGCFSDGLRGF